VVHLAAASTFVGRAPELAAIAEAHARARSEIASIVLVGGEAGIGKSTLVREAAGRAHAVLYLARCVPHGGDVIPLAPLADLLRQVRRQGVDVEPEVIEPLLRWLSPTGSTRAAGVAAGPGELFEPVLGLLRAVGADGAVVAFEDLHWADTGTWGLFDHLARNLSDERVLLVGTYRTDEVQRDPALRRRLAELARLDSVERLVLQGLDGPEVAARVDALLGAPAPSPLVAEVVERGQGNPFFTEQLVAAHLAGEQLPALLSELLASELAAVDEATRQVLGAVATIGRDTTHELLAKVTDVADADLETSLRAAIDAQLLVVDPGTDRFRFRHALIAEVAYGEMLPSQRARLHGRVAVALREQSTAALSRADRAGELAFHLDRAGDREGAFAASLAAADAATAVAPGAALVHLQRALELWPPGVDPEQRVRRMWEVAEYASGVIGNGVGAELARAAFAVGDPPRGRAWGHERLARYLGSSGQLEESRRQYELAEAALSGPDDPGAPGVFSGLAQAEVMASRYDEAERWCERLGEIVRRPEDDPLAWTVGSRVAGLVAAARGDTATAVERCRRAVASAPGSQARGIAVMYLCVVLLDAGANQEVVDLAGDAAAEAHRSGIDPSFGAYTDALAADALVRLGRWNEAATVLERHRDDTALPVGALRVACARAVLAARRGDRAGAAQLLDRARALQTDDWHQALLRVGVAETALAAREWDTAREAAEAGLAGTPQDALLWQARFRHLLVDATVELVLDARAAAGGGAGPVVVDDLEERLDELDAAVAGREVAPDVRARLAHARASLSRLGPPDPDAWSRAVAAWTALGDRWWSALSRSLEGEASAAIGELARAADALRDANDVAALLGADELRARVEAIAVRCRLSLDAPTAITLTTSTLDGLGLTPREAEVLALVTSGLTNRQIGERLFVSEKTASVHVSNLMRKMGATSRVDAAAMAQRLQGG
jgi:DNA-binding CsgD family transcriptional regulator